MIYSKVLKIGNKVDLTKSPDAIDNEGTKKYFSQILDLIDDDKAVMAMPTENGRVIPLTVGDRYSAFFYTAGGIFTCKCEIVERYKEDGFFVMLVKFLSQFEKYQRRQYFRLDLLRNIEFRFSPLQEEIIAKKIEEDKFDNDITKQKFINTLNAIRNNWQTGVATDISGGGMKFNSNAADDDEKKVVVRIKFNVANKDYEYEILCDIVSKSAVRNKSGFTEYRIKYANITREERENLIKYIFEEERRRRRDK